MTTDDETASASSWQSTMTRDKLSDCLVLQRLKSSVRKLEKRWTWSRPEAGEEMDVGEPTVVEDQQPIQEPVPTVRVGGSSSSGTRAGSGSRANEANTDDRDTKLVRFTESRGLKRQGDDVEELAAKAE